jgi:HK97 family phage prohead protease
MEFVINDERKENCYGFAVSNSAIDLDLFKQNPVMLYNHNDERVIGRWKDFRTAEDGKLFGTPEFDDTLTLAADIKGQVERGFLRGASMGIMAIEARRKSNGVKAVPTVTKCRLLEISIVAIPANESALALYDRSGKMTEKKDSKLSIQNLIKDTEKMDIEKIDSDIRAMLKLSVNADEAALNAAIKSMLDEKKQTESELKNLKADIESGRKKTAEFLVDAAIAEGRLTADKRDKFVKFALSDIEMAKEVIGQMAPKKTLAGAVKKTGAKETDERDTWTYMDWLKKAPKELKAMQTEDAERFNALKQAYGKS